MNKNKPSDKNKEVTIIKTVQVTMILKFDGNTDDSKVMKAVDKANDKLKKTLENIADDVKIYQDKMFVNLHDVDNFTGDKE
jgi:hypothetical protein